MVARPARIRIATLSASVLAASGVLVGLSGPALAADYTVHNTLDPTGPCTSGPCSLRQLVTAVNDSPFPPDTIRLPAGTYHLDPDLGAVLIETNMSIVGAGAGKTTITTSIPADRTTAGSRIFDIQTVSQTPVVTISGVTITGGTANENNGAFGGDILSAGDLTLVDDWISNGFACSGGGISNDGGTLDVERSLVSGDQAGCGGGDSGGIQNFGVVANGPTPASPGHLIVDDSTITGNQARQGAGMYSWNSDANTTTILDSTIAGNVDKSEPSGPALQAGAGIGVAQGSLRIGGSIVANNTEVVAGVTTRTNCATPGTGTINSFGYNLDSGTDCGFGATGDEQGKNPQLLALHNNGGPTQTLALTSASPAVDRIPRGRAQCLATDQRGVSRPQRSKCDIGAYELIPPPNTTIKAHIVKPASTRATFRFTATGAAVSFQCGLAKRHHNPAFSRCRSPKTYDGLKKGTYTFQVRAQGPGGTDPTPAKQNFRIT